MSTVPVNLLPELHTFIDSKVQAGHYANASDYIVALVTTASIEGTLLDEEVLEGIGSGPAQEWSSQEWQELKNRLMAQHTTPE
jgi:putative addiction module CopG family antidote